MWPLAKGRAGDSQRPHFIPPKAEHQESLLGARLATQLEQLHRQPRKSSQPSCFTSKRCSLLSPPVPSASSRGVSELCCHSRLQMVLLQKAASNQLNLLKLLLCAKKTLLLITLWGVPAHTHTQSQGLFQKNWWLPSDNGSSEESPSGSSRLVCPVLPPSPVQ